MGLYQGLTLHVKVDLEVVPILPKIPELELCHQMKSGIIHKILSWTYKSKINLDYNKLLTIFLSDALFIKEQNKSIWKLKNIYIYFNFPVHIFLSFFIIGNITSCLRVISLTSIEHSYFPSLKAGSWNLNLFFILLDFFSFHINSEADPVPVGG